MKIDKIVTCNVLTQKLSLFHFTLNDLDRHVTPLKSYTLHLLHNTPFEVEKQIT